MITVTTDPAHPRRAPQFTCSGCGRLIGKTRAVYLIPGSDGELRRDVVLCIRCKFEDSYRSHARWYPECPHRWHDMYDHPGGGGGTRAGIAAFLGLWP